MVMKAYSLEQTVDFPTRIYKDEVSLLDHIFLDTGKQNHISAHTIKTD
jgi:hypothetical protein